MGTGTIQVRLAGKVIRLNNVYHVPRLDLPLLSIRVHHPHAQGCSFLSDFFRVFLHLPWFYHLYRRGLSNLATNCVPQTIPTFIQRITLAATLLRLNALLTLMPRSMPGMSAITFLPPLTLFPTPPSWQCLLLPLLLLLQLPPLQRTLHLYQLDTSLVPPDQIGSNSLLQNSTNTLVAANWITTFFPILALVSRPLPPKQRL